MHPFDRFQIIMDNQEIHLNHFNTTEILLVLLHDHYPTPKWRKQQLYLKNLSKKLLLMNSKCKSILFRKKDNPPTIRRHFIQRINHSHLAKVIQIFPSTQFVFIKTFRNVTLHQQIKKVLNFNLLLVTMATDEKILFGMHIVDFSLIQLVVMSSLKILIIIIKQF